MWQTSTVAFVRSPQSWHEKGPDWSSVHSSSNVWVLCDVGFAVFKDAPSTSRRTDYALSSNPEDPTFLAPQACESRPKVEADCDSEPQPANEGRLNPGCEPTDVDWKCVTCTYCSASRCSVVRQLGFFDWNVPDATASDSQSGSRRCRQHELGLYGGAIDGSVNSRSLRRPTGGLRP